MLTEVEIVNSLQEIYTRLRTLKMTGEDKEVDEVLDLLDSIFTINESENFYTVVSMLRRSMPKTCTYNITEIDEDYHYQCSNCLKIFIHNKWLGIVDGYCRNCGAKIEQYKHRENDK